LAIFYGGVPMLTNNMQFTKYPLFIACLGILAIILLLCNPRQKYYTNVTK
jgi:hypothetical protein